MNIKGQPVLVTGADGFIGSHLVEALVEAGARVRAFCYYNSFSSLGWIDTLDPDVRETIEVITGDVRDGTAVAEALGGCTAVFHLAALIGIPFSYRAPESYVDTNIKGTLNVLQAAREQGTARVMVTSTSEVYGTAQTVPIDESHPMQGQSPYSATKIAADRLAESFYRSFELPVVIARPFNTFGPRQSARAVIPTIIGQLLAGQPAIRLGNIMATRDFCYVRDTVDAMIALVQCDAAVGEEVNIGRGEEISVGDLAELIADLLDTPVQINSDANRIRPARSEVERLVCDAGKLKRLTGWTPHYSLPDGLRETIAWMRDNLGRYKVAQYNI